MDWKSWAAIGGIVVSSIGIVLGVSAGLAVSISSVAGLGVSSLTLFHALERVPALQFDGFVVTQGTIRLPPRAGWITRTYSVQVKKAKGVGMAQECEGVVSLVNYPLDNMRSRWLPDDVVQCNIGGHMDLIVFETIPAINEIVFFPVSLRREMAQMPFRLEPHLDIVLSIEVHSKNAES